MVKLKIGDKVTWNIKRGVNPKGMVVEVIENYSEPGDTRYVVKATENITFKGRYGVSTINKGDILQPFKPRRLK